MEADTGKVTATPDVGAGNDARSSTLKRQTPLPRQADQHPHHGSGGFSGQIPRRRECSHAIGRPDDGFGSQDSQYPSGHCPAQARGDAFPGVAQHLRSACDWQVRFEMTVYIGYCGAEYQTRSNRLAQGFSRPEQCWWRCRFSELVHHAARKCPA
jgi:hypothetical protein